MGGYKFIDHTADVGIEVKAGDRAELFTNAARGMFAIICDVESIKPVTTREFSLGSDDLKGLLHEWLAELLYLFDTYLEIYVAFSFEFDPADKKLRAVVRGEEADEKRHGLHGEIKNVTWYDYVLEANPDGSYYAKVFFDL